MNEEYIINIIDVDFDKKYIKIGNIFKEIDGYNYIKCIKIVDNKIIIIKNNFEIFYYLLDNIYYSMEYIENNFKIFKINKNNKIYLYVDFKNILKSLDKNNLNNGIFEIINDILIVKWNNILSYYEKDNDNIYNNIIIPENFDCNYYIDNYSNSLYHDSYNNLKEATIDWIINEKNAAFSDNGTIYYDNNINNIIINHTHKYIKNLNNNKYYNYENENYFLNINNNSFIIENNNNIVYENNKKLYLKNDNNFYEEYINNFNLTINNIYIVGYIGFEHTSRYLKDIINKYKNKKFIFINKENEINLYNYEKNDIFFIQYLFLEDFNIKSILDININIIINVHDYYWIDSKIPYNLNNYDKYKNINNSIVVCKDIIKLFEKSKYIIFSSPSIYNNYKKYFNSNNFLISPNNDYEINNNIHIPKIINNLINIIIFGNNDSIKGNQFINYLPNTMTIFNNYKINYLIENININKYNDNENFMNYINNNNINAIIFLYDFYYSYSYILTKAINSGLPIIYNNIGDFKEKINISKKSYFKINYNESENYNFQILEKKFINFLNFLIKYYGLFENNNYKENIKFEKLYDDMFL